MSRGRRTLREQFTRPRWLPVWVVWIDILLAIFMIYASLSGQFLIVDFVWFRVSLAVVGAFLLTTAIAMLALDRRRKPVEK